MTTWKTIPEYQSHEASDSGLIRRFTDGPKLKAGAHLKQYVGNHGYPIVNFGSGPRLVHRLVMSAFHGLSALHVNHKNGVRTDNRLGNLEYVTLAANNRHAKFSFGRYVGEQNGRAKLSASDVRLIRSKLSSGETMRSVACAIGCSYATVAYIKSGRTWRSVP